MCGRRFAVSLLHCAAGRWYLLQAWLVLRPMLLTWGRYVIDDVCASLYRPVTVSCNNKQLIDQHFSHASVNTQKRREHNLIYAAVNLTPDYGMSITNSRRLRSMFCTIEANYWQTRSIARPLCDSRATCSLKQRRLYRRYEEYCMKVEISMILPRHAMHTRSLRRCAVSVRPFVCSSSVCHVRVFSRNT